MRRFTLYSTTVRILLPLALVGFFTSPVLCQEPNLDRLARRLSKSLNKSHVKTVIVSELVFPDSSVAPRDQALADRLSNALKVYQGEFVMLERSRYQDQVKELRSRSSAASPAEWAQEVGRLAQADAVVACTVESDRNEAKLSIQVYQISNAKLISRERETLPGDSLFPTSPLNAQVSSGEPVYRAGQNGVTIPTCAQCPPPHYSPEARHKKFEGTVVLEVVISAEGRVGRTAVVKDPGMGLAEKAIDAVRNWRFKPAVMKGKPVAVLVPIEVTFRLFK